MDIHSSKTEATTELSPLPSCPIYITDWCWTLHCLLWKDFMSAQEKWSSCPSTEFLLYLSGTMHLWQAYHFYDSLYSQLIFLSADSLTWLSDPCLFQVQKLLLYHQLKWLPRLFLMLPVLHQHYQKAHYLGSGGKHQLQTLDNTLIKHDLYSSSFPKALKSTSLSPQHCEKG